MNYGGPQDQRYGGGQSLTDGYDYDGEKNYYGQQGQQAQQLPSFPSFSNMRGTQQPPSHPYHGGLHQSSPSLLGERVLPPMSSVARGGPSSMSSGGGGPDMGVSALSAAAAAHQMSRLGEAFKDSLVHQMGKSSSPSGSLGGPGPSSYGLTQQQQPPYGMSTSGHSDRLYGGSANPFPNHGGTLSGGSGSLSEKSSPRSSTQRSSGEAGYGLPTVTTRGSGDRGVQLPAPSISAQIGANGAAHQAAVSLSHIASGAGSQLHPSSTSVSTQQPTAGRTAASMNPKDLLELYSKWDQLDNKAKRSKNEEVHAEEVRKERHNMAEKRRRSDMNGAIERLKTLLPQQVTNDRRLTKVEVLTEAADHLTQVQNLCAKLITENKRLKALVPGVKMEDDDAFLTRGNEDDAAAAASTNNATSDSSGSGSGSGDDVSAHEDERERRPATADERCSGDGGDGNGGFGDGQQQPPAKRLRRSSPGDSSAGSGSDNGSDSGASSSSSESASTESQQRHNIVVGAPRSRHNSVGSDSQQSGSGGGDDGRGERDGESVARVPSDDDGRTLPHHHHAIDEGVEGRDSDNSNDGIPTASTSKRRRTASASDQGEPTTFANLHFPSSATSSTPSTSSSTSSSLSSSSSAAEMSAASAYGHHYHQQHYGGGSGGLSHHQPQQQQHFGGGGNGGGLSHHLQQQQPHPYHHHPQHHM